MVIWPKSKEKVFNWSEVHLYRSNFLQHPYFSVAIKSDNVTFYACQINKRDIWLQFKKNEKKSQDGATIQKHQK